MILKAFACGPFATNAIVIACETTRRAAIIDPSPGSHTPVSQFLKQHDLVVDKILLTHSHLDHTADLAAFKNSTQAPIYIHPLDAPNIVKPGSDGLPVFLPVPPCPPDHLLADGQDISIGNLAFKVIHTPGHSPGGVCFYCASENLLISGDTLFKGSIGNISFPTAEPDKMWTSLDRLATLPPATHVYPGHGPSTTIGAEHWLPRAREMFGD